MSQSTKRRSRGLRRVVAMAVAGGLAALGAGAQPTLVDRTRQAGLDFVHVNGMSGELYFVEMMGGGVASLDYDGDGDQDLYLVQGQMLGAKSVSDYPLPMGTQQASEGGSFSDRLFRNDQGADGARFVDVTARSGIEAPGYGMGVAAGDYDNDGQVDLYITNFGPNQLLRNNGDGTFSDKTEESRTGDPGWSVAASFFDYDGDGWLDLFVGNYVEYRLAIQRPCQSETGAFDYCSPLAYPPARDRLYRNRGDGTFEDATERAGLAGARGAALGAVTADFDGDGRLDLYVANDGSANQLWMNQGDGTFFDDAVLSGSAVNASGQPEASMGVVAGDLNGDGSEDLFMAHLTRETNTLYLNDGSGLFREATQDSGLGMASWQSTGFGTVLADFDLDGRLDLFVANGAVKRLEAQLRTGDPFPLRQKDQLFAGLGGGRFVEVGADRVAALELAAVSRGAVASDLDNDGRVDVVEVNNGAPARILRNESGPASWLGVVVERHNGAPELGAWLELTMADDRQVRRVRADGSYASARDARVVFGVGGGGELGSLEIVWPYGGTSRWLGLAPGRYYRVNAPTAERRNPGG